MGYSVAIGFAQGQNQSLKQNQRLMMSPQMQQAIHLLQVPVLELEAIIDSELEQNPILEYIEEYSEEESETEEFNKEMDFSECDFEVLSQLDEEFRDHFCQDESYIKSSNSNEEQLKSFLESSISQHSSLIDLLMEQARGSYETQEELYIAEIIIGSLDDRGFLTSSLEELSLLYDRALNQMEEVLEEIQEFDPPGVGARDEKESLLLQLRRKGVVKGLAYEIISAHFDELLKNKIPMIAKKLGVSNQEVGVVIEKEILPLDLRPGVEASNQPTHYLKADVHIALEEGRLHAFVQEDSLPSLRLNPTYMQMLTNPLVNEETKEYIKRKIASSKWLCRNIRQRNDTLLRIAERLIERQKDFFLHIDGKLQPMTMKMIAEDLELHESTIARAVAGKYLNSPKGLILLRSFFTHAYCADSGEDVSARTVKDLLLEIIRGENKTKPFSDEVVSKMIQKEGIPCARRTVAKYRKELNIGNTSQRREYT